jgi:hypothetical protein
MSTKQLVPTAADRTLAKDSAHYFCAVKFQTNRKANFDAVLRLCRKADLFEAPLNDKKSVYLVAFGSTHQMMKLASVVIEEMSGWKFTLFAGGRMVPKHRILNVLSCYLAAKRVRNHKSHCTKVYEPYCEDDGKLKLDLDEHGDHTLGEEWILPCRRLDGFIWLKRNDPVPPIERLEAVANQYCANLCPLFTTEGFAPIKKISKAKRFW